jgi:uroporphyrinogen decarboxylase
MPKAGDRIGPGGMAEPLGHRERVLRAIEHREVDRVPFFFAAEEDVQERVMAALGLREPLAITRHFDADTIHVGVYQEAPDLSGVTAVEDLEKLEWPSRDTVDLEGIAERLAAARATGLAVLSGAWATIFTGPRRRMGEAKFLMAMVDEPELIARVAEKLTAGYLDINEAIFSRCAKLVDVYFFGSDFGTQESMFISRDMFRRFFKGHLARLAGHAKGFGLKVMYHTCGAVSEIIPDLVECGVDMLDPVQVSARGMAPVDLARGYKGRMAFHGGISTQTVLPWATPEEVRVVVRETIAALGPTGYIAGPDQWMMRDIPLENMTAMYEAVRGYAV